MICTRLALLLPAFLASLVLVSAHASAPKPATKHVRTIRTRTRRSDLGFSINDPADLASCTNTLLTWNGTKPPYSVGVLVGTGSQAPLYHLGNSTTNMYTWEVDLLPNTTVTIAVKNKDGDIAYSNKVKVSGTDTSCLQDSAWAPASSSYAKMESTMKTSSSLPTYSVAKPPNSTATGNVTNGIGNNAAATASPSTTKTGAAATQVTAGLGLLLCAAVLALVA